MSYEYNKLWNIYRPKFLFVILWKQTFGKYKYITFASVWATVEI